MPTKTLTKKPATRKKRSKPMPAMPRMFQGNVNTHACRISTGEMIDIPGFNAALSQVMASMMSFVVGYLQKQNVDPQDVHIAFEVDMDTNDHPQPKEGTEQPLPARVM